MPETVNNDGVVKEDAMTITTKIFGVDDIRRATEVIGLDTMMDQIIDRLHRASEFARFVGVECRLFGVGVDKPRTLVVPVWVAVN